MRKIIFLTICLICISTSACANNLPDEIYSFSSASSSKDRATGFVVLSNLYLTHEKIEKIEADYLQEKSQINKYYYEYLLSKRTQEEKYVQLFIENSWHNIPDLTENKTNWISVESPFYKQLAYYARVDESALQLILKLTKLADGAMLSVISSDLLKIKEIDSKAFYLAAEKVGLSKKELRNIMEDE